VIGKIKNAYGQWEGTKSLEMAKKGIWAKVIAYNWVQVMNFLCFFLDGWPSYTQVFYVMLPDIFEHTLKLWGCIKNPCERWIIIDTQAKAEPGKATKNMPHTCCTQET